MNYALYTILFSIFSINAGNSCSSAAEVKKLPKVRSIQDVVNGIPLQHILILHLRARTADFDVYNMAQEDQALFRKAVASRYEENKKQIDAMARESDDRYRHAVHVPIVRQRRRERRQPQRVRFPDSVVLQLKRN